MTEGILTEPMLALILFCVATEAARELCFKGAADGASLQLLLKRPLVWAGIFFWAVEIIAWISVLAHVPLTIAFPIMSLVYVVTVLGGAMVFKEKISPRHALGALLITAGVACVGVTGQ